MAQSTEIKFPKGTQVTNDLGWKGLVVEIDQNNRVEVSWGDRPMLVGYHSNGKFFAHRISKQDLKLVSK